MDNLAETFKCPSCGKVGRLYEVNYGCTIYRKLLEAFDDDIYSEEDYVHYGLEYKYMCSCGLVLTNPNGEDISNEEDLISYLKRANART